MTPRGSFHRHAGGGGKTQRLIGSGALDAVNAAAAQRERCARGEHDRRTARLGYVTFAAYGRLVKPGESYCAYCGAPLPPEADDA